MLALRTGASGGSASRGDEWLTPNVPNGGRSVPEEIVAAKGATENGKRTVGLESQSKFWTTPQAHDVTERGSGQQPSSKAGNACLARDARLWPTPVSNDDNKSPDAHLAMKARMKGGPRTQITSLSVLTQLWPTPRAAENGSDSGSTQRQQQGLNLGLKDAAKMWPTPHGFQAGNGPDGNEFSTEVRNWTTPKASDGAKGGPNMRGSKGDVPLPSMAANWASPTARIAKGGGSQVTRKDGQSRLDMLDWQAESFSRQDPPTRDGPESSPTLPGSRQRLNPEFAGWLMGWPIGWTSTEPTVCGASEMVLFRRKQQLLLSILCGG